MFEVTGSPSPAAELAQGYERLLDVSHRVEQATRLIPHYESGEWRGPAALAFHRSVEALARELARARQDLRVAAELTSAAIWQLGDHV